MQIYYEGEQASMFVPASYAGKMCREPSPAESGRARTSASSWRRSSELSAIPFMSLDLTPGRGNLLGEYCWEMISPYVGDAWTLNTGVSPRDARGSSLSQILEEDPSTKYYLTAKACSGILRRAFERGKALPKKLERALKIQAGLALPDGQITDIDAYHINQRDEGIDLQGVSGALMATSNMQMQTFVTQASENTEGFDGYNGDLTGDVAATLGVNCGMSTGRNGVIAFAANQRDEVRDLHDVAGALNAQPGIKQQTFVAGFSAGAGASAGSIGYHESVAPTLKAGASGNCMPSVLCINDQGGQVMEISEGMTGTLRAQEHGHQPLVYENHGIDSRYRQMEEVAPTMSARYGTGGNNVPLVEQEPVICITRNAIDRQPQNGGNGIGYQQDIAYTLTATDHHAVYSRQRVDDFRENDVVSTQSARQRKDAVDLICQKADITAAYPAQGISVQGQQVFLRTSRVKWWLSKCIWCIASCTLYFACEMIAIIGTAILTPVTFGLNNTPEITAFLFSEVLCGETISLTPASVILYALILPFVTLTAVCMLQTLLNLVVHPAISFLICFVTYIAAAYFPIEWLIGNGAMVMRYQLFDANGLSYRKELVFTLLLLLLSIGAGYLLIQRKDLISLEK